MTKNDELIEALVSDLTPVRHHALRVRLALTIIVGVIGAAIALLISLSFRPHLHHVTVAAFWVKFLYTAVLLSATIMALERVARPEGSIGSMARVPVVAFGIVALLAIAQLGLSPASSYPGLIIGYSASFVLS